MATYQFIGETNAVAYEAPGYVILKKYIDFADLVSNPQKLALASAPNTPLSSFSYLDVADVLQVFHVPAGFVVFNAGMYNQAIDTQEATAKLGIGDGDSTVGFMAATILTAGTGIQTVLGDAYGSTNMESRIYLVDDTVDIICSVEEIVDAKIHVYAVGFKCFDITSVV